MCQRSPQLHHLQKLQRGCVPWWLCFPWFCHDRRAGEAVSVVAACEVCPSSRWSLGLGLHRCGFMQGILWRCSHPSPLMDKIVEGSLHFVGDSCKSRDGVVPCTASHGALLLVPAIKASLSLGHNKIRSRNFLLPSPGHSLLPASLCPASHRTSFQCIT